MIKHFKFLFLMLAVSLAATLTAFGQATTGSIEGVMKDPNGALLPGATVNVKNIGASTTGFTKTTTTGDDGYFIVPRVPVGDYEVSIEKSGFKTQTTRVTVTLDRAARVDLALALAGASVSVDVNGGDNVTIDPTQSRLQTNITKSVFEALPKGTTFTSLLKTAPNVRPEALSGGFQVDGASGSENVWVVDGQEVTNFRTGILTANNNLPFELIQEVQVKSTGFEAEYGGATGGVITVVTQGGNDSWHGNFGTSFRPQRFQGTPHAILNRYSAAVGLFEYFGIPKDSGLSYYPVAKFNGPIVRNKMWFSGVYAPQIFDYSQTPHFYTNSTPDILGRFGANANPATRIDRGPQEFDFHQRTEEAFMRLDAQPSQKVRLFGSFLWNPISQHGFLPGSAYGLTNISTVNPFGPIIDQSSLLNQQGGRQNSNSLNGQATFTPTARTVVNVHAGRSFLNEKLASYGIPNVTRYTCNTASLFGGGTAPGPAVSTTQAGCSLGFNSFPSNFQTAYDVSTRSLFDADASMVGINAGGRHNFKFGYQYNKITNNVANGYKDTGVVVLYYGRDCFDIIDTQSSANGSGCGYIQRFGTVGKAASASNAVFVQDSWTINNRLTLNLGIRFDQENVPSFKANNPGIRFGWGSKIAPRVGFAYDITGKGKTKIFGSWGRFYDRFKYELPRGSFGGDFYRRDWFEITQARGFNYASYTFANILGSHPDPIGGARSCASNIQSSMPGYGYAFCENDFRIPSNSGLGILISGAVDPNIKAARQSEFTFGAEHQLFPDWILSGRFTKKKIDRAVEDAGAINPNGSEAYIIGNPGIGLACATLKSANFPCTKPQRDYTAFEVSVNKRMSHHWFFNASYTRSKLFGNYAGLASSDEAGRTSPNVDRNFDLPYEPYTFGGVPNNGRLATDRPNVFKAYGGYNFDWSKTNTTEVSFFTTAQSGTPLTTYASFLGQLATVVYGRGDLGRSQAFRSTDLNVDHKYRFGRDGRVTLQPFVNILNLFDRKSVTGVVNTISSSSITASVLRSGGCPNAAVGCGPSSSDDGGFDNAQHFFFSNPGGFTAYLNAWLAANTSTTAPRQQNTYKQPNAWSAPREVRFGFRVYF